ncbi:hypothetical protein EYC80_001829 [Monilinia laxa]|uniref:Uncharacterized protein n=1 Tax=Monilinia laxa TaxID=61186 RepID=A0A5N6K699_MONLA|nr:hypothetical protein EYC80_001829 [Monilinia laxa]
MESGYFDFPTYSKNNPGHLLPADAFLYGATISQATYQEPFNTSNSLPNQQYAIQQVILIYNGPLLSSALVLFPDWSNLVDDAGGIDQELDVQWPLSKFTRTTAQNESYASYLTRFSADPNCFENSLRISTFLATKASWEVASSNLHPYTHPIFTEMGKLVQRPTLPIPVIIIVSILIAYVTLSVLYLGIRSSRRTWTTTLNPLPMILLLRDAVDRIPKMPVVLHSITKNESRLMRSLAESSAVIGDMIPGEQVGMLVVGAERVIELGGRRYRDAAVAIPYPGLGS